MARPISDETAHKVTLHINNGYRYATLRPRVTNEATGKRMNKSIHLGTVTESLEVHSRQGIPLHASCRAKTIGIPTGMGFE